MQHVSSVAAARSSGPEEPRFLWRMAQGKPRREPLCPCLFYMLGFCMLFPFAKKRGLCCIWNFGNHCSGTEPLLCAQCHSLLWRRSKLCSSWFMPVKMLLETWSRSAELGIKTMKSSDRPLSSLPPSPLFPMHAPTTFDPAKALCAGVLSAKRDG